MCTEHTILTPSGGARSNGSTSNSISCPQNHRTCNKRWSSEEVNMYTKGGESEDDLILPRDTAAKTGRFVQFVL